MVISKYNINKKSFSMQDPVFLNYLKIKKSFNFYYRGYNIKNLLGTELIPYLTQRSFNGIKLKSIFFIRNIYFFSRKIIDFLIYSTCSCVNLSDFSLILVIIL